MRSHLETQTIQASACKKKQPNNSSSFDTFICTKFGPCVSHKILQSISVPQSLLSIFSVSCQGTPTVPLPVPYWRLHCLPTHGSHRAHGWDILVDTAFSPKWRLLSKQAQNGCQMLARFPPYKNRSCIFTTPCTPKIVSLQKFTWVLTCSKKYQQHDPTKVNLMLSSSL